MSNLLANYRPQIKLNYPRLVIRAMHGPGTFSVAVGDVISPETVLGKYQTSSGFSSINLASRLHVAPAEGEKYLQKPLNSRIYRGELLAIKKSLLGDNVITAATDGIIDSYNAQTGELRLRFFPRDVSLPGGVFGVVEEVDQKNAHVAIKTFVNEISGVVGSGHQRLGLIKAVKNPSNLAKPTDLTSDMVDNIAVLGALVDRDVLIQAVTLGLHGVISGGINFRSFKPLVNKFDANVNMITDVGTTVCITEGFGPNSISEEIFALLIKHQDQIAYISGEPARIMLPCATAESISSLQKIVLPPHRETPEAGEVDVKNIDLGQKARIIWPPFMGTVGKIIAIDAAPTTLASGVATYLVTIETSSRKIKVPYPNLELI